MSDTIALAANGDRGGSSIEPPHLAVTVPLLALLLPVAAFTAMLMTPTATIIAATAALLFGLPHGAFDLNILVGTAAAQRGARVQLLGAYLGLMLIAGCVWVAAPALALLIFMVMAAVHFGEDWTMIEAGLLRHCAGFSIIAVVTLSSPQAVEAIFAALAGAAFASTMTTLFFMAAPVAALVTIIALVLAVQAGHPMFAAAQALALVIAMLTPPMVGFAVYFAIVHSAMHLGASRRILSQWPVSRFAWQGLAITFLCTAFAVAAGGYVPSMAVDLALPVTVFQILAILTVPHLLLTHGYIPMRIIVPARPWWGEPRAPRAP